MPKTETPVGVVRSKVINRDGWCVALRLDPDAGYCYDQWGELMAPDDKPRLEMDYVRSGAINGRHERPEDHVALCPGHHRGTGPQGGRVWATANRSLLRRYLEQYRRFGR